MALENELETFRRELSALLTVPGNRGAFALVHGAVVAGCYPTFEEALAAGYDQFGLTPFLVKEVTDREEPRYFSRALRCRM
ncbi:hypothetical protein GobsT_02820 [Gemmata obscuriglobus]|uniref:DUF5678 domain-containing protein n=2 Tax=Gemmata TaxID=113 RepID=A0A2Z3HI23_9BACT|nr:MULTISPECIES: hypothetical protein [Gemmata]AWM41110.1 hypothetical protein C1280_31745 [Gemmata obscuriglobus]MDY3556231.1 hypothetical protein [Gemmata algarum]MDY3559432.1 hypothetical protein [Gemmata algarum]QEG25555.1 hypothetical protein GobsT_02820 [Gemmata obscuriglobus]VTR98935.1 unnamed protein product [Gemmata obscuriglobus UQM 2246]